MEEKIKQNENLVFTVLNTKKGELPPEESLLELCYKWRGCCKELTYICEWSKC